MRNKLMVFLSGLGVVAAAALMVACGSNGKSSGPSPYSSSSGSLVVFGTDTPLCDVQSFIVTITSASLVPQSGGSPATLIGSTSPATVDFARLADLTNVITSSTTLAPGTYSQLQLTLANPQLVTLNTATNPATVVKTTPTLTPSSVTVNIKPALTVSGTSTTGLTIDFSLLQSLQVNALGQLTGIVTPQITASVPTLSGTTVGEATSLYGIVQTPSANAPSGFTGTFGLALDDGTGQTLTVLTNSSTTFEGDGVTGFSNLTAGTFAEVDAIVNTSGQVVAQTVDSEEPVSATTQNSAFLGTVIALAQDGGGNATAFSLLVADEVPSQSGAVPLNSILNVTLTSSTNYFTVWQYFNKEVFIFGPPTLGLGQKVAVYGSLTSSPTNLTATQVYLRPTNVLGNFTGRPTIESGGITGGFAMTACGGLFAGNAITVLTSVNTTFKGVSDLTGLTTTPLLNTVGILFYEQKNGESRTNVIWSNAPTWVTQARVVDQVPQ